MKFTQFLIKLAKEPTEALAKIQQRIGEDELSPPCSKTVAHVGTQFGDCQSRYFNNRGKQTYCPTRKMLHNNVCSKSKHIYLDPNLKKPFLAF